VEPSLLLDEINCLLHVALHSVTDTNCSNGIRVSSIEGCSVSIELIYQISVKIFSLAVDIRAKNNLCIDSRSNELSIKTTLIELTRYRSNDQFMNPLYIIHEVTVRNYTTATVVTPSI